MGKFSLTNLFGMTIRESANDGSDFTNPDADYRRLFLGEDGQLHVKDSAGTVTDIGAGSGAPTTADYLVGTANGGLSAEIVVGTSPGGELGGTWASPTVDATHSGSKHNVPVAFYRRTAGDYTIQNNGGAFEAVDSTNLHLTIAAATNDILEISFATRISEGTGSSNCFFDIATIVSAAAVNFVSGGTGLSTNFGIAGWLKLSGFSVFPSNPVYYTVQAGDISGGNVVVELWYRSSSTNTVVVRAGTSSMDALFFGVKNLRQ